VRLGLPAVSVTETKCSLCGVVTNIAVQKSQEAKIPPRMPRTDEVRSCSRCKILVAVPEQVVTFQCADCGQVNVAGCIRGSDGHL